MAIEHVMKAYKEIEVPRPSGDSDKAGRWYPSSTEKCSCCRNIRSPSREYPWSLYKHCYSTKHLKHRLLENPTEDEKLAMSITLKTAPLYINSGIDLCKATALLLLKTDKG